MLGQKGKILKSYESIYEEFILEPVDTTESDTLSVTKLHNARYWDSREGFFKATKVFMKSLSLNLSIQQRVAQFL